MKQIKEGVDFKFNISEDNDKSIPTIELLSGEFSGVTFEYGKVKVEEDEENETASLAFEYSVIDKNNFEDLESNENFKNHLGDILVALIQEGVKNKK